MCDDLILDLEAVTVDSEFDNLRLLDGRIAVLVGWTCHTKNLPAATWKDPQGKWHLFPPFFTLSVDAALTLIPMGWTVGLHSDCKGRWFSETRKCGVGTHIDWPRGGTPRATNGAIAIAIAALEARSVVASAKRDRP